MVDVETDPGNTLNKKIRNAQLAQYNFILGMLYRISEHALSCDTLSTFTERSHGITIHIMSVGPPLSCGKHSTYKKKTCCRI